MGAMIRRILAYALAVSTSASAAPPENADPRLAPWFESLLQPGTDIPCCSVTDCRAADSRVAQNGYEVLIDGEWEPVPPDKILHGTANPIGRAVVCWSPAMGVLCFVRGTEI